MLFFLLIKHPTRFTEPEVKNPSFPNACQKIKMFCVCCLKSSLEIHTEGQFRSVEVFK